MESPDRNDRIVGPREASGPGPELMGAGTLIGDEVRNTSGELLGKIKEIVLDVPQGRIAYAVLAHRSGLGVADKLFAVPWAALVLDTAQRCFVLDVAKERLKDAPGFNKDRWPSMADPRWAASVRN